jgi:pantothenate kinase
MRAHRILIFEGMNLMKTGCPHRGDENTMSSALKWRLMTQSGGAAR